MLKLASYMSIERDLKLHNNKGQAVDSCILAGLGHWFDQILLTYIVWNKNVRQFDAKNPQ